MPCLFIIVFFLYNELVFLSYFIRFTDYFFFARFTFKDNANWYGLENWLNTCNKITAWIRVWTGCTAHSADLYLFESFIRNVAAAGVCPPFDIRANRLKSKSICADNITHVRVIKMMNQHESAIRDILFNSCTFRN